MVQSWEGFFFEELPIPPEATKSWIFAVVAKNSLPCLEVYSLILTSPPKKYTMTLFLDPTLMSPCHSLPSEDFASFGVIRYYLPIFGSPLSSGCLTKTVWLRTTPATMPVIIIAIMTIIPPIFKIFLMITSLTSKSNVSKTL